MMRYPTILKLALIVISLISFQPGCKIFKRADAKQIPLKEIRKEILQEVPDMNAELVKEGVEVYLKPTVLFDFDKAEISGQIKDNLNRFAAVLQRYPDAHILVRGHTDNVGTDTYNQTLSEERAQVVKDYLLSQGINASRLKVKGYGNTLPRYDNSIEAGRMKNRRVEFLIFGEIE